MKRILLTLLAGVALSAPAAAQEYYPSVIPAQGTQPPVVVNPGTPPCNVVIPTTPAPGTGSRLRGSADYLLWFLERQEIASPLIGGLRVQGQDLGATLEAGGLYDPNTVVAFGGGRAGRTSFSGMRAMVGYDLSDDGKCGIEVGGFWLPRAGQHFTVTSDANGVPAISLLAFFNNPLAFGVAESGGIFAGNFGGVPLAGFADAYTATQLWGADLNLTFGAWRGENCQVEGLVGFRYVGMNDLFSLHAGITQNGDGSTFDRFATLNNFYGGQIGWRGQWRPGMMSLIATSKIAFGVTTEELDISGNAILPSYAQGFGPQLPGGFYTAASNIGKTTETNFAIVYELNLTARLAITERIGLTVGYSFFYWSEVQRAGNNVSRELNPTFNPAFSTVTGQPPLSGTPAPPRLNNTTDFWANGLNVGVQIGF